jgi:hypothetical protein
LHLVKVDAYMLDLGRSEVAARRLELVVSPLESAEAARCGKLSGPIRGNGWPWDRVRGGSDHRQTAAAVSFRHGSVERVG